MNPDPILQINNLTKTYKKFTAVNDVSFEVRPGEIVGLLGPNGAGKTTIINMVLGVLEKSSGTMQLNGFDMTADRTKTNQDMNFAAVYAHLPGNLTVRQNLYVFSLLYSIKNVNKKINEVLVEFDLVKFANTKTGLLSSGEQSRVNLAKATLNDPCLLLFDEPTASLDPSTSQLIRDRIRQHVTDKQAAVLWTSHNMQEVSLICDRVLFLSRGKILLEGDPKTLPQAHGKADLEELFIAVAREPLSLDQTV
ncbi:MAG: ABC transporter ATP-binding protein [Candidatus Falkowbacteria bacterium]